MSFEKLNPHGVQPESWYGVAWNSAGHRTIGDIEFDENESVQQIKYGRYPTEHNSAMCYPLVITNLKTYGPFGEDMDLTTDGVQKTAECDNEVKGYQK